MEYIKLANLNKEASKIGFGCAPVMGRVGKKNSLIAMEKAFENGVTYFDIARSYGYGEAEKILGEFSKNKREKITIATKFGILPSKKSKYLSLLKPIARPLLKFFPDLRPKDLLTNNNFTIADARKSIERSLHEMKCEYIDILLIHDCFSYASISNELIEYLEGIVKDGTIKTWGITTHPCNINEISTTEKKEPNVLQYEFNVIKKLLNDNVSMPSDKLHVLHSPFGGMKYKSVIEQINNSIGYSDWLEKNNIDKNIDNLIYKLFLEASLILSPSNSIIICSMFKRSHIKENTSSIDNKLLNKENINGFLKVCKKIIRQPENFQLD